jgi:hypothetical protein
LISWRISRPLADDQTATSAPLGFGTASDAVAILVAVGVGAALAGFVTAFPHLDRSSEQKTLVFGVTGALLRISRVALWVGRRAPNPADPALARSCKRLRQFSAIVYALTR